MQNFAQFKTKLRLTLWPAGEAKNLRVPHDNFFRQAMMEIQKFCPCVQQFNTSEFKQCATFWEDAKTVVPFPIGYIRDVYTIANDDWRDQVHYESSNWNDIQRWATDLYRAATPANVGLPKLPMGYRNAEASTDSVCGRARVGIWAYNRHRLFVAPWIQSNETLVVEWDGLKTDWVDTDGVNELYWTVDYEDAIALYVRWKHEMFYGDKRDAQAFEEQWNTALAGLMWNCREMTRQRARNNVSGSYFPTLSMIQDDSIPDAETPLMDALIGDWGVDGTPLSDVVDLIEGKTPRNVFTLGDNIYGVSGTPDVDSIWGKYWSTRIFPYTGVYTAGTEQSIWASFGNHDFDYGITTETNFLTGLKGNRRYYSVVSGPVHYFIISTDPREADGGYVDAATSTQTSIMGEWLRVSLAMSTAKWKVVIGHHPPFSSDVAHSPGAAWMRWPFKLWGAHMTLWGHSHNYEEFTKDGIPYIVNGLGGNDIRAFSGVEAGSVYQYNDNFGAGFILATCDSLTHYFYSRNGTLIRTVSVDYKTKAITAATGSVADGGSGDDDNGEDEGGNMSNREILQEAASNGFQMLSPVPDENGDVISSPVLWSDGSSGTYTRLTVDVTFLDTNSWQVTYDRTGKTITQPAMTRDTSGNVTVRPALVMT